MMMSTNNGDDDKTSFRFCTMPQGWGIITSIMNAMKNDDLDFPELIMHYAVFGCQQCPAHS
jgi:hypothetical protein